MLQHSRVPLHNRDVDEEVNTFYQTSLISPSSVGQTWVAFWQSRAREYPTLGYLAARYCVISPTSADVERLFSHATRVARQTERNKLSPDRFRSQLFVYEQILAHYRHKAVQLDVSELTDDQKTSELALIIDKFHRVLFQLYFISWRL